MKKQKILDRLNVTPEKERLAKENLKNNPLEKNDMKAIMIAAFLAFVLPTILVLGVIAFIIWLIIIMIA
ncbi:MAG: hypothetical protein PHP41_00085 [Bacilli bacterium]|jgi:cell division septal protein FtsQ|nr:hypothetical protein [Bacilli bacterium]MDY0063689.1 hypothetical protein [Bacilli bacterium]